MKMNHQTVGLICAFVGLLVYLNTLDCDLVFDDEPAIKWNKDLRPGSSWMNLFWHDFWGASLDSPTSHKSYRPLCVATFRLNYLIHELQPMGYHLVNVLLHSAVCYLYVQLCGLVFREMWPALIAGLLFAVHPIHTEAVAGTVGRAELLSAVFFLGALLAYRRGTLHPKKGFRWLILSLMLSMCSMLSKEQGITVVVVCLVYDFFIAHKMDAHSSLELLDSLHSNPSKQPRWFKGFVRRSATTIVFTAVALVLRIAITHGGPSHKVFHKYVNPPTILHTPYRQLSWMYLCFVNSWLLINPSHLSADWRYGAIPLITSVTDPRNILTLATFAIVALLALYGLMSNGTKQNVALFGLALLVIPYIPASNLFFPVGFVVAERVLYLPSMGFCLLVGYGTWRILQLINIRVLKALAVGIVAYLLAIHSMKTVARNRDWHSSLTIYTSGVRFNPNSGVMLANLGIEYAIMKNYSYAEHLYRTATEVAPQYSRGYFNLGKLMKAMQRFEEAEWPLRRAIECGLVDTSDSKVAEAYALLVAVIAQNSSRIDEALSTCESALSMYPHYAKLYEAKGGMLLKANRTAEAAETLEEAIQKNPNLARAHYNLGLAYMKTGERKRAERAFRNVLLLDPKSTHAMLHLAVLLQSGSREQDLVEAEKLLFQILSTEPHNTDALLNLGQVYEDLNNHEKAIQVYQRLLQLSPEYKDGLYKLGRLYYKSHKYREAVVTLSKLQQLEPQYLDVATKLAAAEKHLKLTVPAHREQI